MKKLILSTFIGVVIGALITTFLFAYFRPRPGPGEPVRVIENPPLDKPAIHLQGSGHLIGDIKLPTPTPGAVNNITETSESKKRPSWALHDGDKLTVPVSGQIETKYFNSRTSQEIGAGVHKITGETTLSVQDNRLLVNTVFNNDYRIGIVIPDPPPKNNEIGLYSVAVPGWSWGGYYQRNFSMSFIRLEIDREVRVMAGLKFQF